MAYNPRDYYFLKAKSEKFVARSVFKLEEIDSRFKILKPGFKVLDLGAAPGSWSQYASRKIGPQGRILGVDLQPIQLTLPNAVFVAADMNDANIDEVLSSSLRSMGAQLPFDVVLSDMAPKTTGIRITDQTKSYELCELALRTATRQLRPKGHFICKLFHGDEFEGFRTKLKSLFSKVELLRPKGTRKESKEIFFVALQFRPPSSTGGH